MDKINTGRFSPQGLSRPVFVEIFLSAFRGDKRHDGDGAGALNGYG
jgi:hypothetical protein